MPAYQYSTRAPGRGPSPGLMLLRVPQECGTGPDLTLLFHHYSGSPRDSAPGGTMPNQLPRPHRRQPRHSPSLTQPVRVVGPPWETLQLSPRRLTEGPWGCEITNKGLLWGNLPDLHSTLRFHVSLRVAGGAGGAHWPGNDSDTGLCLLLCWATESETALRSYKGTSMTAP
jgi:hypothetical protein